MAQNCDTVNRNTIIDFINFSKEKGTISDCTINTRLRAIRAFLNFCMNLGYLESFKIQLLKVDEEIKDIYTDEELRLLLKKPDIKKCTFVEYRNWVLTNYLLGTANRKNTVLNLKIEDLNLYEETITLKTIKNRKQQTLPLTHSLTLILTEYLRYRKGEKEDYLFCTARGQKIASGTIENIIRNYNLKRGVNKTSIHLYRHTFAKKWILGGGDLFSLQIILRT